MEARFKSPKRAGLEWANPLIFLLGMIEYRRTQLPEFLSLVGDQMSQLAWCEHAERQR